MNTKETANHDQENNTPSRASWEVVALTVLLLALLFVNIRGYDVWGNMQRRVVYHGWPIMWMARVPPFIPVVGLHELSPLDYKWPWVVTVLDPFEFPAAVSRISVIGIVVDTIVAVSILAFCVVGLRPWLNKWTGRTVFRTLLLLMVTIAALFGLAVLAPQALSVIVYLYVFTAAVYALVIAISPGRRGWRAWWKSLEDDKLPDKS